MEELTTLISPLLVALCLLFGNTIKYSLPKINNRYIPLILALLGGILSIVLNGLTTQNILIGVVSGLASTGLHQVHKGIVEKEE